MEPQPEQAVAATPNLVELATEYGWTIASIVLLFAGLFLLIKMWPFLTQVVAIGNALIALPKTQEQITKVYTEIFPENELSLRQELIGHKADVKQWSGEFDQRLDQVQGAADAAASAVASPPN